MRQILYVSVIGEREPVNLVLHLAQSFYIYNMYIYIIALDAII